MASLALGRATMTPAQDVPPRPPAFVVLPSSLPHAPAPIAEASKMPQGYLDRIGRRLGLNPCDYGASRRVGKLVDAVALVEAGGRGCVVWDNPSTPQTTIFLGSMNVENVDFPVVAYAKMPVTVRPSVLVLDLVGGPAGDISPGLNDAMQEALARRGAVVVKPAYAGTRHRSRYPAPDFDAAVQEVVEIAAKLRRTNPHARLILMGESLGGYIAAKAVSSRTDLSVDGMLLAVPLIYSPDDAVDNFTRLAHGTGERFTRLWIRPNPSLPTSKPRAGSADRHAPQYQAVSSIDLFKAYFPESTRTAGLLSFLLKIKRLPTVIAYGKNDDRVGVERLQDAVLPANVHLLRLENSGHAIGDLAAERIADKLWSTLLLPTSTHANRTRRLNTD